MDTNTKYRRWGWGAVIGLIAVILIAGLVVALTMSKKPNGTEAELAGDGANSGVIAADDDKQSANGGSSDSGKSDSDKNSENKSDSSSDSKANDENTHDSSANANNGDANNGGSSASGSANNGGGSNRTDGSANNNSGANNNANAAGDLPKTGPIDTTIAIIGMAATAYLLSLNYEFTKEKARK